VKVDVRVSPEQRDVSLKLDRAIEVLASGRLDDGPTMQVLQHLEVEQHAGFWRHDFVGDEVVDVQVA
jgi:hypothetical protein